jgi:hypothetical protein
MDEKTKAALKAELDSLKQRSALSVWSDERLLRALFYGDFGAGKTTLASQIAYVLGSETSNTALLTTDSNWTVIQNFPDVAKTIDRYDYEGLKQIQAMILAREQGIEPYCSYKTLIWDTASTGVDYSLRIINDATTGMFDTKHQIHPLVEGRPHYRILERGLRDTINILSKSTLNVIYTSHYREPSQNDKEDKVKKQFAISPNIPESSFKVIAGEVQLIGWVHKENKGSKRLVQFEGTLNETAKSQIPTISEKTYPATEIPELIKKWKEL